MFASDGRGRAWWASALLTASAAIGCSRSGSAASDPSGDVRDSVMPPPIGGASLNPALAGGQAEWIEFRPPPALKDRGGPEGTPAAPSSAPVKDEGVAEVRELVEEYNGVIADGDVEALLEYFVAEQEEALRPVFTAAVALSSRLGPFCQTLEASQAGTETERSRGLCRNVAAMLTPRLNTEELRAEEGGTVMMRVSSRIFPAEVRAVKVEEDWYFQIPDAAGVAVSAAQLSELGQRVDQWSAALGGGTGPFVEIEAALTKALSGLPESAGPAAAAAAATGE